MSKAVELLITARDQASPVAVKALQAVSKETRELGKVQSTHAREYGTASTQMAASIEKIKTLTESQKIMTKRAAAEQINAMGDLTDADRRQWEQRLGLSQGYFNKAELAMARKAQAERKAASVAVTANTAAHKTMDANADRTMGKWQKMGTAFKGAAQVAAGVMAAKHMLDQPVNRIIDYDKELVGVTNTVYAGESNQTKEAGMAHIREVIVKANQDGGGTREDALGAYSSMIASGKVSQDEADGLLGNVMKTASGGGAAAEDIAQIVVSALTAGISKAHIPELLDRAMKSGNDGGVELKNMAKALPGQLALARSLGMNDMDGISWILSANQMAKDTAGTPGEATNNVTNLLAKINSSDISNKAKKIKPDGVHAIDWNSELRGRTAKGMNAGEATFDIIEMIISKDKNSQELAKMMQGATSDEQMNIIQNQQSLVEGSAIGKLITDQGALMAALAIFGKQDQMDNLMTGQGNATGAVDNSYDFYASSRPGKREQRENTQKADEDKGLSFLADWSSKWDEFRADFSKENPEAAATASATGTIGSAAATAGASIWGVGKVLAFLNGTGAAATTTGGVVAGEAAVAAGTAAGSGTAATAVGASKLATLGAIGTAALPFTAMWGVSNWAKDTSHDKERVDKLQGVGDWLSNLLSKVGFESADSSAARIQQENRDKWGLGGNTVAQPLTVTVEPSEQEKQFAADVSAAGSAITEAADRLAKTTIPITVNVKVDSSMVTATVTQDNEVRSRRS